MSVKLLPEHHLEFLGLKGGCKGSSESTLVKMPHCWKSHVTAHLPEQLFFSYNVKLHYITVTNKTVTLIVIEWKAVRYNIAVKTLENDCRESVVCDYVTYSLYVLMVRTVTI